MGFMLYLLGLIANGARATKMVRGGVAQSVRA